MHARYAFDSLGVWDFRTICSLLIPFLFSVFVFHMACVFLTML